MSSSHDIIVIGAGVLGLCSAVELARRGHSVLVVDPGQPSASSVAAGMIAPAAEAWADFAASGAEHAALFTQARDLWPEFSDRLDIALHRDGLEWRGPDADAVADAWSKWGFPVTRNPRLFTPADWRVAPEPALAAMRRAPGLDLLEGKAVSVFETGRHDWLVTLADGAEASARAVVVATGVGGLDGPPDLTAALARISPIRGQLGFMALDRSGPVVRGAPGYVAPAEGGAVFGATMDFGRMDLKPDADAGAVMAWACLAMVDADPGGPIDWRVGIRGASPDGLPMAGHVANGLFIALAPRRNGWLLGPMVGQVVADAVAGRKAGPNAEAFDPARFP